MLFVPRIYELASEVPDKHLDRTSSPFPCPSPSREEQKRAEKRAFDMLLVHQSGGVKVGEVVRYTLTYEPSSDRILPSPSHLHVRIKNTSAIAFRAAYLHGPYTLHVAVYPSIFNPNSKLDSPRKNGVPQFEPNLKAGGAFTAKIPVPEEIRVTGHEPAVDHHEQKPKSMTWIIEVTSQILFSASASVSFEVLVSRDERSLEYNFTALTGQDQAGLVTGQLHDHQQGKRRHSGGHRSGQPRGVHSKAISLVVDDLESLWNKPELPKWDDSHRKGRASAEFKRKRSMDQGRPRNRKKKKIHLVILTHGLHSNLGADMLYMKESIDATARQARENAKKRKRGKSSSGQGAGKDPSTAPLSGGQEDLHDNDHDADSDDDDEQVIVRGFSGNAVRTENGIQYLGKRLAKYILDLTYPDQPFKPLRKSMTKKLSDALSTKSSQDTQDKGKPAHENSTIRHEDTKGHDLAYTFTSISFIGHSLGGLIQLYAIGYIQKHAPLFFEQISPVNFICLASPLLGLSNENPMYVKFALDFGLVGRTGQDLGLTWRPTPLARTGWAAMMGGLGTQKDEQHEDPGSKPLLRILPTGPAHRVLRRFRNRTVYSNVVNDGIVPLRTSCLLFLDWRGLERVGKARRENGILGTMAGWGWAEITGQSASQNPSQSQLAIDDEAPDDSDAPGRSDSQVAVPQPDEDATNKDDEPHQVPSDTQMAKRLSQSDASAAAGSSSTTTGALDGIRNFLGLTAKTTKKDLRMYRRSQTIKMDVERAGSSSTEDTNAHQPVDNTQEQAASKRPLATRGDTIMADPTNSNAPPKTSIFESAGDILNPPIPPTSWIIDPTSRTRTIFHDRVYHPEDIPPPPMKRPKSGRSVSGGTATSPVLSEEPSTPDLSSMRVEERIARAYHKDLSWRKVLVRLEPDAHNNMIVRRMFANAYGWPVVKHLCDTHFGDTYAALTRDEEEPATDRAKGIHNPVGEHGEHVKGQEAATPPPRLEGEMREAADELKPLKPPQSSLSVNTPARGGTSSSIESFDSRIFDDTTDDEDNRGLMQKFWPQSPKFGGESSNRSSTQEAPSSKTDIDDFLTSSRSPSSNPAPEIADFLTTTPPVLEVDKSFDAAVQPGSDFMEVGLRRNAEEMVSRPKSSGSGHASSVSEQVARSLGSPTKTTNGDGNE